MVPAPEAGGRQLLWTPQALSNPAFLSASIPALSPPGPPRLGGRPLGKWDLSRLGSGIWCWIPSAEAGASSRRGVGAPGLPAVLRASIRPAPPVSCKCVGEPGVLDICRDEQKRRGFQPYLPRPGLCPRVPFLQPACEALLDRGTVRAQGPAPGLPLTSSAAVPPLGLSFPICKRGLRRRGWENGRRKRTEGKGGGGGEERGAERGEGEEDREDAEWAPDRGEGVRAGLLPGMVSVLSELIVLPWEGRVSP